MKKEKKQKQAQIKVTKDPHDDDSHTKKFKATMLGGEDRKKKTPIGKEPLALQSGLEDAIDAWIRKHPKNDQITS